MRLLCADAAPVYFEDEYLDAFAGRGAEDYTREETDQFEYVLTTLKPTEVAEWLQSLALRGIELPLALRDEVTLLLNEA